MLIIIIILSAAEAVDSTDPFTETTFSAALYPTIIFPVLLLPFFFLL